MRALQAAKRLSIFLNVFLAIALVTPAQAYSAAGQAVSTTYPDFKTVSIGYNARVLPITLTTYVEGAGYDALGRPVTVTNGAGVTTEYSYDPDHFRLSSIGFSGSGAPSLSFGYGYDNAGNVKAITETGTTTSFSYDHLDRLTAASDGYTAGYGYDVLGDILTKTEGSVTRNLDYTLSTRPKHAPATVDGVTQGYDANGNLLSDGVRAFTYDAENRLTQVVSGTATVDFSYDPDGKRYKKTENGQATFYAGKHYETDVATETKYYDFLGQPVAISNTVSGATYLYRDHLGSTNAGSNGSSRSYWPFGSDRSVAGGSPTDRLYTGQQSNASVGLYYYGARFYDPDLGRFVSPDSIVPQPGNPQALNRYSYALDNPLRYKDPTGHWVETAWDVANVAWDIHEFRQDPSLVNGAALVVDAAAAVLPFVPAGLGMVARAGKVGKAGVEAAGRAGAVVEWSSRFAGASEAILQAVSSLASRVDKGPWAYRYGLEAQLRRAEEYFRAGKLKALEFVEGHNRYDLVLASDEVVEVKYWRESYAKENLEDIVARLEKYQGAGREVVLEFVKTKTDGIGHDFLDKLWLLLRERGVDISRDNIRLVD